MNDAEKEKELLFLAEIQSRFAKDLQNRLQIDFGHNKVRQATMFMTALTSSIVGILEAASTDDNAFRINLGRVINVLTEIKNEKPITPTEDETQQ